MKFNEQPESFLLLTCRHVRHLAPASPKGTDRTGINACSEFIAKVSRKRPVLFRRFRGTIDFFFFRQVFAKMHFLIVKVLKFYRDATGRVLREAAVCFWPSRAIFLAY